MCIESVREICSSLVGRVWTDQVHYSQGLRDSNEEISQVYKNTFHGIRVAAKSLEKPFFNLELKQISGIPAFQIKQR